MTEIDKQLIDDGTFLFKKAPFETDLALAPIPIGPGAQTNNQWHISDGVVWVVGAAWAAKMKDPVWPDPHANAVKLCGDPGNVPGALTQTIEFARPGQIHLRFWARAASYEASAACASATLTLSFGTVFSEDIPVTSAWQQIERTLTMAALPKGVHNASSALALKGKAVVAPCAPLVHGFDVRYLYAPVAHLVAPVPVSGNNVLIKLNQPVPVMQFHLTDGASGPPLAGTWVVFTLSGTGVRFVHGTTVTLQTDASGNLSIAAGTMTAEAALSGSQLDLAVDGDRIFAVDFVDVSVQSLVLVEDRIDSTYVNTDFPLQVKAQVMPADATALVHFAIDSGKQSVIKGGGSDVAVHGGVASINLTAGSVPEGFHVTASVAGFSLNAVSLARWVNPVPDAYV